MANKQHNTPEHRRGENSGFTKRRPLVDGEGMDDLDDDLPPYAAGEEAGDEDDLLTDDDLNADRPDDYGSAGKRQH